MTRTSDAERTRELAARKPARGHRRTGGGRGSVRGGRGTRRASDRSRLRGALQRSLAPARIEGLKAGSKSGRPELRAVGREQASRFRRPRRRDVGLGQFAYAALLLSTLGLLAFGLVMVFSASSVRSALTLGDEFAFLKRQILFAAAGVALLMILSRIDLGWIRRSAGPLLAVATMLLLAVLLVAAPINGAKRWLSFGPVGIQPSELAKLALALWLAMFLARRPAPRSLRELLSPVGMVVVVVIALVLLEPDLGTAIVLGLIVGAMFIASGTPVRLLAFASGAAAAVVFLSVWLEPWRRDRFFSFLDPWADPEGAGFQSVQALIAIGSGGLFGNGLGESVQKVYYLPEASTDMIFAVIAEELGLVGALALIALYAAFLWAGFAIALRAPDPFGKRLAVGLTVLVGGQAMLNLAAVVGIAPLTGLPLPFVSYGGSHLVVALAAVGILLNIAQDRGRHAASMPDRSRRDGRSRPARAGDRRSAPGARRPRELRRLA